MTFKQSVQNLHQLCIVCKLSATADAKKATAQHLRVVLTPENGRSVKNIKVYSCSDMNNEMKVYNE